MSEGGPLKRNLLLGFLAIALGIQAQTPAITAVTNGASYSPLVSPGAFVAIFGGNFGDAASGTSVTVGGRNAPVYFVSNDQINVQLPSSLPPGPTTLTVSVRGAVSAPVQVDVARYAPALLTADASGAGLGVFTNLGEPLAPVYSAAPGQTVVAYAIGLGAANGASPTITVGGVAAGVHFIGPAPNLAAVDQVAFVVPPVGLGNQDVVLSMGGVNSPAVVLPIGPASAIRVQGLNPLPGGRPTPVTNPISRRRPPETSRAVQALSPSSTITYTCNANISAAICNTLNTTIASLYSSAFTNAGASIYIQFGSTGLGESLTATNTLSYSSFRNALIANQAGSDDATAITKSVPSTNPYGSDVLSLTNANMRALGFSATFGVNPSNKSCALGAGCYDGIITISSSENTGGNLYFRPAGGPAITGSQYDFYTVVEHETDEVLGTASCLLSCSSAIAPADLFRYHSNGARSFAAGDNNTCSTSGSGNACFSIDGVDMLVQYNNVDNGDDFGDWVSNCSAPLVQDAVGCPGVSDVDISPSAEIQVLDVVGFTLVGATGVPALTINKTHTGNFAPGQAGATYTITVANGGAASTSGSVSVSDTLPSGLTLVSMAGGGWTCAGSSCSRSDSLAAGLSYPSITATVNVLASASSPQVNSVSVSGGGSGPSSASDSTTIVSSPPVLTVTKTHTGSFTQGQAGATYTITAANTGASPTSGMVSITDTLPSGLTLVSMAGGGWTCAGNVCTRSDSLGAGLSYPGITATVNVLANASSPQVNSVSASGGGSAIAGASDSTTIVPSPPALTITKTHTGSFTQGQAGAAYTITASNNGTSSTSGMVTVTDTLPSGLTLVSMAGSGWTCAGNICTRSDSLAAGAKYPSITATVNVKANAGSPQVNSVSVSGGGSATASASDSTTIVVNPPVLTITKTHLGNFTQGQAGASYTITAANSGAAPTSGMVTVTDTVPSGLTLVTMAGNGWTCAGNFCTRSDSLAAGASYPSITAMVNVAANATSPQVNSVSVSGGGSATASATDSTTIAANPPFLSITKTHAGSFTQGQLNALYTVTVSNQSGAGPTSGLVTVTEIPPAGLTVVSMAGTGWTCSVVTCTRSDVLNGGSKYPAIAVTVNVAANAASPQVNQASLTGGGTALVSTIADSTVIVPGVAGTLSATPSSGSTLTYVLGTTPPSLPLSIASNPSGVAFSVAPSADLASSVINGNTPNTPSITVNTAAVTAPGTQSGAVTVSVLNSALDCASPVIVAGQSVCTATASFTMNVQPSFFQGETPAGGGFFNLASFGTYTFTSYNPVVVYHTTLGFEIVLPGTDVNRGIYLYDNASAHTWYTNPSLFPYVYDFNVNAWLYYFGGNAAQGGRSFYNFGSGTFIFL